MFHAKRTKFEQLYARKCQKSIKNLKNETQHVISSIWLLFWTLTFSTQWYIPNSVVCQFLCQTNQVRNTLSEKVPKNFENP